MENKESFSYKYIALTEEERREIESIKRQYVSSDKAESPAERLKSLHSRVVNSAACIAISIGIVGLLIFGLGMACVLEWNYVFLGVILSVIGAATAAPAYLIYSKVLESNKAKYGEEIVKLSEQILGEDK